MTIGEFKAFLEGMDVQGAPTPEQWERIKAKIEALEAFNVPPLPVPNQLGMPSTFPLAGTPEIVPYTTCGSTKMVEGRVS